METEVQKTDAQVQDEKTAEKVFSDPYEYLATFANAPSKAVIEAYKTQAPNGVVRLLALGKRAYVVRGLSGLELNAIQGQVPSNLGASLPADERQAKIESEVAILASSKGIVWTSTTQDGKLTADQLRGGSAGLPSTIFNLVTYLSDFLDPQALELLSTEL
jgi:hypothetical protein